HCEHQVLKQDLIHKHKEALQVCKSHNLVVMKTNRQGETEALEIEVREEQMMDDKILVEMDQKVINQQNTLEIARVPGFYITTNPQLNQHFELTMQINRLKMILTLPQKESQ
uniref:DiGeorge syndrome critical region gene 6 n=1 Tax=Salmo trutta TaxID=8032 RepID=A0A674CTW9_SALTR